MEELPDLVVYPLEVATFVDLLFVHRNLDVLFLRGINTMFVRNNYFRGLKLVEEWRLETVRRPTCSACWSF